MPGNIDLLLRSPARTEALIRGGLNQPPGPAVPRSTPNTAAAIGAFFVEPLALAGAFFGGSPRIKGGYELVSSFDPDTGLAQLSLPAIFQSKLADKYRANIDAAVAKINRELGALAQQAVATGVVPANVPRAAQEQIGELAQIGRARAQSPPMPQLELSQGTSIAPYRRNFVPPVIPTGANTGWQFQTPAAKALLAQLRRTGARATAPRKRSKKSLKTSRSKASRKASASSKKSRAKRGSRSGKFVKGSKAAKLFMAKLRAKRKK